MRQLPAYLLLSLFAAPVLAEMPPGHPAMNPGQQPMNTSQQQPVNHGAIVQQASKNESDSDFKLQGKVLSVLKVPGYTYIETTREDENIWLAVPEMEGIKEGDTIRFMDGPVETNFKSRSLDRTFPKLMLLTRVIVNKGAE